MSVDNSRYIYYHGPMFIFSKYICYVYWMFIGEYIYQGTTCMLLDYLLLDYKYLPLHENVLKPGP